MAKSATTPSEDPSFTPATLEDLKRMSLDWLAPELLEDRPKLVLLDGPMGSGKTTFVSGVAEQLGAGDAASPSFALHSRYTGHRGTAEHFDLDRVKSLDELESIGFWDIIEEAKSDPRRFVFIEWASRLSEFGVAGTSSGQSNALWMKSFRVWKFEFSGLPSWTVKSRRLVP